MRRPLFPCLLLAGVVARAETDPWAFPEVDGMQYMMAITLSEKEFTLLLADEVWEGADGAERVEIPLQRSERSSLDKGARYVEEGEHDKVETIVKNLLRRNRANYEALILRARSRHARGMHAEALVDLRESLIGNRRNPIAWELLEEVARSLGKRVVRPRLRPRGWVRETAEGEIHIGHAVGGKEEDFPWSLYAASRTIWRYTGRYKEAFPGARQYRFSFREQIDAVASALSSTAAAKKPSESIARLQAERKAGRIVPFLFFAMYPEPIGKEPESDFEQLRPRLQAYFDEWIVVDG